MTWVSRTVLTISLTALPLFFYVGFRLAASVALLRPRARRISRRVVLIVVLWLLLFPALAIVDGALGLTRNRFDLVSGGTMVQFTAVYPFWIALISAIELVGPCILIDVTSAALRFRPAWGERWLRRLAIVRLVVGAGVIVFVALKAFVDTSIVRNDVDRITCPDLPRGLEGVRISLVADLQVDRYTGSGKIGQMQRAIEAQRPELVMFAGDIATGGSDYIGEAVAAMCGGKGSIGSIAVMGDHDYWSDPGSIVAGLRTCGWDFLLNEHHIVEYQGRRILVTGLTHVYSQRLTPPRLDSILASAPPADFKIILVHQPAQWLVETAARYGYNLLLAGHTHGGQVVLHPFGVTFTPSMRETRFYSGVYTLGGMAIVVTNGVGLTLAPLRYCAPAEVTTVVLERAEQ